MQDVDSSAVQVKRGSMIPSFGFALLVAVGFGFFSSRLLSFGHSAISLPADSFLQWLCANTPHSGRQYSPQERCF